MSESESSTPDLVEEGKKAEVEPVLSSQNLTNPGITDLRRAIENIAAEADPKAHEKIQVLLLNFHDEVFFPRNRDITPDKKHKAVIDLITSDQIDRRRLGNLLVLLDTELFLAKVNACIDFADREKGNDPDRKWVNIAQDYHRYFQSRCGKALKEK